MIENYHWQITDYGLETNVGQNEYAISVAELFKTFNYEGIELFYSLILLMGREWVIRDDIVEIYPLAVKYHAQKHDINFNQEILMRSIKFYIENDTWLKSRPIKAFMNKL